MYKGWAKTTNLVKGSADSWMLPSAVNILQLMCPNTPYL